MKTNFGFELGLLTEASYQGQARCRTVWELTKGHGFLYMWMEQLKKTNFGLELSLLTKAKDRCASEQFGSTPKAMDLSTCGRNN